MEVVSYLHTIVSIFIDMKCINIFQDQVIPSGPCTSNISAFALSMSSLSMSLPRTLSANS